jgi:hypothetical protein
LLVSLVCSWAFAMGVAMFSNRFNLAVVLALVLLPTTLLAHHSRSEFSDQVTEIEGELVNVIWRNPHAGLDIEVTTADGSKENWRVETFASPNLFGRMGVFEEHFVVGEQIRVAGNVSEKRSNYFLGLNALFENGKEAVMSATLEPRWSQDHVGGSDQSDVDLSQIVDAATENKGIFRVWSIAGRTVGVKRYTPYSDASRADMAVWDPVTAPVARCEAPGMPIPMTQPLSFVVENEGDTLKLTTEYFGVERTIHVGDNLPAPETQEASPLGYSVGHWQDERTFVVETSRINYPYFSSSGAKQSEDITTTEYFRLSEDQTELAYRIEMNDPLALTDTAYSERLFVALGAEFVELDCTLF